MAKNGERSCCRMLAVATAMAAAGISLVGQQYTPMLLKRDSMRSCLPPDFSATGTEPVDSLAQVIVDDFNRDGAVLIRGGLR